MTVYKRSFWRAFWDTERWADRRSMVASVAWYAPKYRLGNRWQDARAVLAGACNASTWTGEAPHGAAGGYSHWRCAKRRGHLRNTLVRGHEDARSGPHRFENYIWAGGPDDKVTYDPIEPHTRRAEMVPFWKLARGRHPIYSRRRTRLKAEWAEQAMEERRAARLSS